MPPEFRMNTKKVVKKVFSLSNLLVRNFFNTYLTGTEKNYLLVVSPTYVMWRFVDLTFLLVPIDSRSIYAYIHTYYTILITIIIVRIQ